MNLELICLNLNVKNARRYVIDVEEGGGGGNTRKRDILKLKMW